MRCWGGVGRGGPYAVPRVPSRITASPCQAHPPSLPLSLSPRRWHGDSTECSCADERQARGLQVTVLGTWQAVLAADTEQLCAQSPAPPRAMPCSSQRCASPCSPHAPLHCGPAASWPATIFIRISEKCPAVPCWDIFRPIDVTVARALPAARPAERTNRRCHPWAPLLTAGWALRHGAAEHQDNGAA